MTKLEDFIFCSALTDSNLSQAINGKNKTFDKQKKAPKNPLNKYNWFTLVPKSFFEKVLQGEEIETLGIKGSWQISALHSKITLTRQEFLDLGIHYTPMIPGEIALSRIKEIQGVKSQARIIYGDLKEYQDEDFFYLKQNVIPQPKLNIQGVLGVKTRRITPNSSIIKYSCVNHEYGL